MSDFGQGMFMQSAQRPGLFSASTPPRFSPFGAPELDSNPLLGMAMSTGMQWLFGSEGFLPGQFMPQQNMLDQIRAREHQVARMTALQQGFALDEPAAVQMIQGSARMMGLPFGAEQAQAAGTMARGMTAMMPFLAPLAPATFDAMFGSRGSQGILTSQVFDRGIHEIDPLTGLVGMSAASAADRAGSIYSGLFDQGPGRGLTATRGMGAGSVGLMYAEMRRLGLGGGSIADLSPERQAAELGVEVNELSSPAAEQLKRDHDSKRSVQGISRLAGAVSAVRDLFGENGRSDAPMQELFQKLNDLTAGGLAMQDPQRMEQMVRQTQATLKMGGMSLDAYSSLLARGSHLAQVMGVDPSAAAGFSLDAAGFSSSAGGVRGMFAPAFGRLDREQLAMTDQQLRAAARGSGQADQMAALVRFQEEVGGLQGEDLEIYKAIKNGDQAYGPGGKPLYFQPGDVHSRLAKYMGAGDAADYMKQREAGQEYIERYRIDRTVREVGQPIEARQAASFGFFDALQRHGFANDAETRGVADALGATLFDMSLEDSADTARRSELLSDRLRGLVGERGDLDEIVSAGYGKFGQESRRRLNRSPQAALQLFNGPAGARARRDRAQAANEAALAQALSPLNQSGPLARFADVLRNPTDGVAAGLARVLGVTGAAVGDAARSALEDLPETSKSIEQATASGRLALASSGVQAAYRMFEEARGRGAPQSELDAVLKGIEGLVGGGEAAASSLTAFRTQFGVSDQAGFDDLLRRKGFTGGAADRQALLRGLAAAAGPRSGGVMGLMEQSGVATSAQVSRDETVNLDKQFRGADAQAAPGGDPAVRKRLADASVAETLRITNLALGDESTLRGLKSSFKDVEASRNQAVELEALAAEQGMSVGELVSYAGADPKVLEASSKARSLYSALGAGANRLMRNASAEGKFVLPQGDKDAVAARRAVDPSKRNEQTLDAVLKATGGSLDKKGREGLLALMGKSGDAERMGVMIQHALGAYKQLDEKGAAGGLDDAERDRLEAATHGLSAIGVAPSDPSARGYKGHVGVDVGTTRRGVETLIKSTQEKEKADDAQSRTIKMTFAPGSSIKLTRDNQLDFSGAEAVGSTPPLS